MQAVKDTAHKIKEAMHGNSTHDTTHGSTTHGTTSGTTAHTGPHASNTANMADPRVDSDRDGSRNMGMSTGTTGTTGLTGTHHTTGTHTTTAGPHSSNLANKADPRVDSDRDGSRNMGMSTGTTGTTGLTGTHHTTTGTHTTTAGPHSSNLANKADPRVDSDRDGSRNMGATGGLTGTTHTSGLTGTTHTSGLTGSTGTTAGPHNNNLMNKADPRVDSDRDGSRNMGMATGTTGASATTGTTGLTGTHHAGTHHTGTTGLTGSTGPATHTSGPHKSDLMNKLDPRVDSDNSKQHSHSRIDSGSGVGSGTQFGASHSTYPASSNTTSHSRGLNQPFDASIHKPSEAREMLGEAAVTHGGDPYDHKRRHSTSAPREVLDMYGPGHQ